MVMTTDHPRGGTQSGAATAVARYRLQNLSDSERDALLASRVSAMLAFVDGDGFPRLVPCWFLWDGAAFVITSEPDKFHVRCLRRNPRASVGVETAEVGFDRLANRQVKGVGMVELFADAGHYWSQRIREKYLGPLDLPAPPTARTVIRLEPARLSAHGGGLRLASEAGQEG